MKLLFKLPIINKQNVKNVLAILSFIVVSSLQVNGQVNFSGVWIQDNEKSDDFYKNFNITASINQTDKEISIVSDFFSKDGSSSSCLRNDKA